MLYRVNTGFVTFSEDGVTEQTITFDPYVQGPYVVLTSNSNTNAFVSDITPTSAKINVAASFVGRVYYQVLAREN